MAAESSAARPIKVMTFNIRFGTAPDKENSWRYRKSAFAACIKAHNPDVACLQEVLLPQYEELLPMLGDEWAGIFRGRDDGKDEGEACAIVFQKDILYCTEAPYTFWLSDTPEVPGSITPSWGNRLPRICMQAHFLHLPSKHGFWLLNAHTDHESEVARTKAAELILRKIPATEDPTVFVGDLNAAPSEASIAIYRSKMCDILRLCAPAEQRKGTFHNFSGKDFGADQCIDYIFATGALDAKSCTATVDRSQYDGRWPSDHFAVIAQLKWWGS